MSVSITFDDGRGSVYNNALPVMREFDYVATVFVITGRINSTWQNKPTMNLTQLHELEDSGWEVGSHSVSHPHLARMPDKERRMEIQRSKEFLVKQGFKVQSFAYPHGYFDETIKIVSQLYKCARSTSSNCFYPNRNVSERYFPYISVERAHLINNYAFPTNEASLSLFNEVKSKDAWVILVFHSIRPKGSTTVEKFREVLHDIETTDLKAVTFIDGFNIYKEKLKELAP